MSLRHLDEPRRLFQKHHCGWLVLHTNDDPVDVLGRELAHTGWPPGLIRILISHILLMNTDQSQLLDQLQDIHAAASPLWWPPAIGWWVLALVLLFLVVVAIRFLKRKLAARKHRREWLQALDAIGHEWDPQRDAHQYLASLNRLFRAVCTEGISRYRLCRPAGGGVGQIHPFAAA